MLGKRYGGLQSGDHVLIRYIRQRTARSIKTVAAQDAHPRALLPDLKYTDAIFNYTRGRFVGNEAHELSQRHVRFNVNELARLAAESIGAKSCVSVEKFPDGMFNKALLLTMSDGREVVAKVPNPNAGRRYLATASEVATMDFVRNVVGTPVPRVLAWSSKAEENDVGAEYIIMERVQGVELDSVWGRMGIADRFAVVKAIAGLQKRWTEVGFRGFGSLYYAADWKGGSAEGLVYRDAEGVEIRDERFVLGPSMGREFFDDGRADVEFDRGPWQTLEGYHKAIGHREMACVKQLSRLPKSPITLCGPGTYQPTRERKLRALECYLKLTKFLLPPDRSIATSHLWHPDLHAANIFVNPSQPTEIVGLIDWQSTELCPLYFQARQPNIIDYDGPPVHGLERPQLPKDIDQLDEKAKKDANTLYLQQSLCSLYNTLTHHQNPRLYAALEFQQTTSFLLLLLARNLLIDGEASYLMQVAQLEKTWDTLPGAKGPDYPFCLSKEERREMEADVEDAVRGMDSMRAIKESLGHLFPEKNVVRVEDYEEAVDALEQMKEQVIDKFAKNEMEREVWRREWPWRS